MVTADLLHPAQRRLMAAKMPPQPAHDVQLRPLGDLGPSSIIVTASRQDFVKALFEDLKASDWNSRLDSMRRQRVGADGILGLSLPMHRRFQIALYEAWCARPGRPRLDPARISGSGIVIRRTAGLQREAWIKRGKSIDGWTALTSPDADPDPSIGSAALAGNAAIRAIIAAHSGGPTIPAAETVHALYPVPPDVCSALGRTILFAVIPVASSETSEGPPPAIDFSALGPADHQDMVGHLSEYLKQRPAIAMPRAGNVLSKDWNVLDPKTIAADGQLGAFGTFLYQALAELDVLGTGPAAGRLMEVLGEISLPSGSASIDAASFLRVAIPVLISREDNPTGTVMPDSWPAISSALGERLVNAALSCLSEQYQARVPPEAKFANANALYTVRGFIRVRGHDDCPDKLVWSMESEPFRILPWWDGEGPATTIALPDLGSLKKIKPSVAFSMPPAIGNLLNNPASDLKDGNVPTPSDSGIAWLCSFSIPFITICAFIVLNIFLSLFDIIFRWMLFIKICIPIPKPPTPPATS